MLIVTVLILNIAVLVKGRHNFLGRVFAAMVFFILLWIISSTAADYSVTKGTALFWTQMAIVGPFLFCPSFFFFAFHFPAGVSSFSRKKKVLIFLPAIIALLFTFTSYNIENVTIYNWGLDYTPGVLYYVLDLFLLIYVGGGIVKLVAGYTHTKDKEQKSSIRLFLYGIICLVIIGVITNSILPSLFGYSEASTYGPALALSIFFCCTAYVIYRHQFLTVKLLTIEMLTGATWVVLAAELISSSRLEEVMLRSVIVGLFSLSSYLLIRSVLKEQRLAQQQYEMVATVSHQLRTPLTPVIGLSAMIADGDFDGDPVELKKVERKVQMAAQRLRNVINDFLESFELEGGKKFENETANVVELIDEAVAGVKDNYEKKGLKLSFENPDKLNPQVKGERKLLIQVFSNLLDNAEKYTPKGGTTVKLKQEGSRVIVTISDTGIGLTDEDKLNLFNKFYRGETAKEIRTDGSGLGLAIVKKIIEVHGAKIMFASPGSNQGTTFTITLPKH